MKIELSAKGDVSVKFRGRLLFFSWDQTVKKTLNEVYPIDLGTVHTAQRVVPLPGPFNLLVNVDTTIDPVGEVTASLVLDGTDHAVWSQTYKLDQLMKNGSTTVKLDNYHGITCNVVVAAKQVS